MKNISKPVLVVISVLLLIAAVWGCKKINITTSTTEATNLVGYMEKYPDTYSDFLKVLDKSGTSSFLNAYGTYTLFAPNNTAMQSYLKEIGKGSIDDLSADDLKTLVRFHLLGDTISTPSFTDGKLPVPTMHGEYLITGVNNENGVSHYIVNRRALIIQANIRTGNGVLHTVDHVLIPSKKSLAAMLEENASYSIFTQALKETGYFDSIKVLKYVNDTIPQWLTVLAESNTVYAAAGINSYEDLKKKYCNTGDPLATNDSLHLYMGYHIMNDLKFIADLLITPAHTTLTPQEIILITLKQQEVWANKETYNGVDEGVLFNRTASDIAATNGVLHDLNGDLYIKVRNPTPVYWDVAEQPEIMKLTSVFRKPGKSQIFYPGDLKDITWNTGDPRWTYLEYYCNSAGSKDVYYWNDRLNFFTLRTNSGKINWIEFNTPVIIKGKYKVWVCWRSNNAYSGLGTQTYIDGELMPRLFSFGDYNYGKTLSDAEVQAQGWKRYYVGPSTANHMASKLLGTIEIKTTGRHKLKFVATESGKGDAGCWLDMIQFIPENMNQFSPRFATDGTQVP